MKGKDRNWGQVRGYTREHRVGIINQMGLHFRQQQRDVECKTRWDYLVAKIKELFSVILSFIDISSSSFRTIYLLCVLGGTCL